MDLSIPNQKLPFNDLESFLQSEWKLFTVDKRYFFKKQMKLGNIFTISMIFSAAAAKLFTQAKENTLFQKIYNQKLTNNGSFSNKPPFDALKDFLLKDKAAFYTNKGYIPEDTKCQVKK